MTTATGAANAQLEALWHRLARWRLSPDASAVASALRALLGAPDLH